MMNQQLTQHFLQFRLTQYAKLMRLDKPIGIFLLLWPSLWALWIAAQGQPNLHIVGIFVLGVIVTRSLGCIVNDICDRKFDAQVERTRLRPLVINAVSVSEAFGLILVLLILALILVLNLNLNVFLCSIAALLTLTLYPLMKRFMPTPQLVLGLAFSWSIPMVYFALELPLDRNVVYLCLANILWVFAYDTQYAMADSADDKKIGIHSAALFFGQHVQRIILGLQISAIVFFMILGNSLNLSLFYYLGLLFSLVLVIYQQHLIKEYQAKNCFKAFLNNNYFGASIFLGLVLDFYFK